ncbi:MAG: hypothetical protein ABIO92_09960, partial [Chloroflexia bacterium]
MRVFKREALGAPLLLLSAALMLYGALGVVAQLRLLPLVEEGLAGWLAPLSPSAAPSPGWLGPLQAHFDDLPWLPWAAWLLGVVRLALGGRGTAYIQPKETSINPRLRIIVPLTLLLLVALGGYARMVELWPQSYGISQRPYDDEGVYAGTSQLFLQGILPYRDYFFAHPPVAAIAYAPAMAYHFTEWGSPTSFMMGRYLSVGYSLVTLGLLFFVGMRLVGLGGGTVAGLLCALDGRVVEINRKIMLEGPMVLLSCAAVLLYLWARPYLARDLSERIPKRPLLALTAAGVFAALSALTKIAGVACLVAMLVDMLWLWFEGRARITNSGALWALRITNDEKGDGDNASVSSLWSQLASLLGGALAAGMIVLVPFAWAAPSQFAREVFFFQLLRPSDGLSDIAARIADLSSNLANPLTLVFAALGFLALSSWSWRFGSVGPWRVVVLWTFFSLLLFTYSRSFYGHYYIQLAAPLCLLGAGVTLLPRMLADAMGDGVRGKQRVRLVGIALASVAALVLLPLVRVQWQGVAEEHGNHDRVFEIVGRYVSDAVAPGTPVLTTDEQFNFLAARPPSRNSTGYLIDSYGHMISLGLGLGTRDWGDLWGAALRGEHSKDVYAVIQRSSPQADMVERASMTGLIVI